MFPNFLGLGAARSGSTWIARNLMQHPDIFLPAKKEIHFFDRHYQEGLPYYADQFAHWVGQKAVGEITPQYFHNPVVAPLIYQHFPEAKLFVCLRNPIERAYSHYWRLVAVSAHGPETTFEEALQAPNDILDVGCYYDHLQRYYTYFPADQILVLIFDDLEANPDGFLRQIYKFLGVEILPAPPTAKQKINAAASLGDLSRSKSVWYLHRLASRLKINAISARLEKINSSQLPPMNPATRKYLVEYYQDQISKCQELLGRDLTAWTRLKV